MATPIWTPDGVAVNVDAVDDAVIGVAVEEGRACAEEDAGGAPLPQQSQQLPGAAAAVLFAAAPDADADARRAEERGGRQVSSFW